MSNREVAGGLRYQGEDERIIYSVDTSPAGGSPTAVGVAVFEEGTWENVTSTVMPDGSPSVDGDVITLPVLIALTAGKTYRIEVKFTSEGNVLEHYIRVRAER